MTASMTGSVVLRRLTTHDLPAIVGWFEDLDTGRYLGGPEWPAAMLANAERSIGTDFRGARQIAADHCSRPASSRTTPHRDGAWRPLVSGCDRSSRTSRECSTTTPGGEI